MKRDDLIAHYFCLCHNYSEMLAFLLSFHRIQMSTRQLRRIVRREGLRTRKHHSGIGEILNAIVTELEESENRIGYRQTRKLFSNNYMQN